VWGERKGSSSRRGSVRLRVCVLGAVVWAVIRVRAQNARAPHTQAAHNNIPQRRRKKKGEVNAQDFVLSPVGSRSCLLELRCCRQANGFDRGATIIKSQNAAAPPNAEIGTKSIDGPLVSSSGWGKRKWSGGRAGGPPVVASSVAKKHEACEQALDDLLLFLLFSFSLFDRSLKAAVADHTTTTTTKQSDDEGSFVGSIQGGGFGVRVSCYCHLGRVLKAKCVWRGQLAD
jgi:hypothetical protein